MGKQTKIPGTEGKTIKELDDAADAYVDQRDKRIALSEKESDAKDALIGLMKKHKVDVYRTDDGLTVTLASKDSVKVTEADESDGKAA